MKIDELIAKKELARRMGIGERAVDGLVRTKKIPVVRLSRKIVRFNWPDVEQALAAHTVMASK